MYAKLQKIISFSLFLISIGLSSLCADGGLNKLLATLPAYSPRSKQIVQQNIQYTARELGVTDTTTKFPSSLNAKAACMIDADSGMVLLCQKQRQKTPHGKLLQDHDRSHRTGIFRSVRYHHVFCTCSFYAGCSVKCHVRRTIHAA